MTSTITRLASRTRTILSESNSLLTELITTNKKPLTSSHAREILLNQARNENNTVAASMLRLDKEMNLVRYHGPGNYVRLFVDKSAQNNESMKRLKTVLYGDKSLDSGGGEGGNGNNNDDKEEENMDTTKSEKSAKKVITKVAFMITSAQRKQLIEMGYDQSQIKKLTPTEAMLVLENKLSPNSEEGELKLLVNAHEEEQRNVAEQLRLKAIIQAEKDAAAAAAAAAEAAKAKEMENVMEGTFVEKTKPNVDGEWFEVVEKSVGNTDEENLIGQEESVVGLYRDVNEANTCREMKEEFANRHEYKVVYTVRTKK